MTTETYALTILALACVAIACVVMLMRHYWKNDRKAIQGMLAVICSREGLFEWIEDTFGPTHLIRPEAKARIVNRLNRLKTFSAGATFLGNVGRLSMSATTLAGDNFQFSINTADEDGKRLSFPIFSDRFADAFDKAFHAVEEKRILAKRESTFGETPSGSDTAAPAGTEEIADGVNGKTVTINYTGPHFSGEAIRKLIKEINAAAEPGFSVACIEDLKGETIGAVSESFRDDELVIATIAASAGNPPDWFRCDDAVTPPGPLPTRPEAHSSIRVGVVQWLADSVCDLVDFFDTDAEKELARQWLESFESWQRISARHDRLTLEAQRINEEHRFFEWRKHFAFSTIARLGLLTDGDPETSCSDLSEED